MESDCPAKKIMKIPNGEAFTFSWSTLPVSHLFTLTKAHYLPVYGIISWCPINRIQVTSDSAYENSLFWSASRKCPIWQFNSSLGLFENHYELREIESIPEFSPGFRFKFVNPVITQVLLIDILIVKIKITAKSNVK